MAKDIAVDQLVSSEEVLAEDLQDPQFREEWERTTIARWLATEVAHFRAENDLSQRALAQRLGLHQSDIARVERAQHTPTLDRLIRITAGLGMELMIDISPEGAEATIPKKRAGRNRKSFAFDGACVVMATA